MDCPAKKDRQKEKREGREGGSGREVYQEVFYPFSDQGISVAFLNSQKRGTSTLREAGRSNSKIGTAAI